MLGGDGGGTGRQAIQGIGSYVAQRPQTTRDPALYDRTELDTIRALRSTGQLLTTATAATPHPDRRLAAGAAMAVIGASCGGVSASITRALSDAGIDAERVNQFRFVGAFIVLFAVLRIARPALMRVPRPAWPPLLVAGLLGSFGTGLAYIASLTLLPIATAQALIYTSPIMLLTVAAVLARQRPTPIAIATVLVAVGGCWLVVNASASGSIDPLGVACALIAAASFSAYITIIGRLPVEVSGVTIVFAMFAIATATLAFIPSPIWTFPFAETTGPQWLGLLGVMLLATLIPYTLFAFATLRLPGPVVGVLATVEPVVAVIVAWVTLGQSLGATQIAGMVLVLCAATAAQLPGFTGARPAAPAPPVPGAEVAPAGSTTRPGG